MFRNSIFYSSIIQNVVQKLIPVGSGISQTSEVVWMLSDVFLFKSVYCIVSWSPLLSFPVKYCFLHLVLDRDPLSLYIPLLPLHSVHEDHGDQLNQDPIWIYTNIKVNARNEGVLNTYKVTKLLYMIVTVHHAADIRVRTFSPFAIYVSAIWHNFCCTPLFSRVFVIRATIESNVIGKPAENGYRNIRHVIQCIIHKRKFARYSWLISTNGDTFIGLIYNQKILWDRVLGRTIN